MSDSKSVLEQESERVKDDLNDMLEQIMDYVVTHMPEDNEQRSLLINRLYVASHYVNGIEPEDVNVLGYAATYCLPDGVERQAHLPGHLVDRGYPLDEVLEKVIWPDTGGELLSLAAERTYLVPVLPEEPAVDVWSSDEPTM